MTSSQLHTSLSISHVNCYHGFTPMLHQTMTCCNKKSTTATELCGPLPSAFAVFLSYYTCVNSLLHKSTITPTSVHHANQLFPHFLWLKGTSCYYTMYYVNRWLKINFRQWLNSGYPLGHIGKHWLWCYSREYMVAQVLLPAHQRSNFKCTWKYVLLTISD